MKSLTDLLLNYPIPGVRALEQRRICAEEASALTGCDLKTKNMQYKNEELTCSVAPVIKSALILRQGELIQKLATRGIVVRTLK
jgi:hypothetical protein